MKPIQPDTRGKVVRDSWGGEVFNLLAPDKNMHRAAVEG
jgi:hypothetical protein